eukprot:CAMPEP_0114549298 /NCGR_PEP_ID=MMETSP0114-20121206/5453_1 /TAXON_ID=31324 /ORGANISM="Goniomonas sp, Strain m" /LENGTH=1229 /DNA_ID=CAMNT_0001733971 /DNA_START=86 /DNA_END=3775 /DNA_ORIENTATION=-
MRQVVLVPAGNHINRTGVITDGKTRFAYCSALAIYVVRLDTLQLEHLIAGYERSIVSFCWNPHDSNQLACVSQDKTTRVWDIAKEEEVASIKMDSMPQYVQWNPLDSNIIAVVNDDGHVVVWSLKTNVCLIVRDLDFSPLQILRWSPKKAGVFATGHEDCSVAFYNHLTKKYKRVKAGKDRNGGVSDIQWDTLSDVYLIAAFANGDIALYDSDSCEEKRSFERQVGGVDSLSWIPSAPGAFFAASGRHGVVRLWNVAQSVPEKTFKVGAGGVHNVVDVGNHRFLCCMADGSVGIYNTRQRRWDHRSSVSHSETVFDCSFKSNDANQLATVSFDETVRLWDVSTMEHKDVLRPGGGAIYCVSWAPGDDPRLAISTFSGKIFICDTAKGTIVSAFQHHRIQAFRVSWNQHDANLVASTSADTSCVVFNPTTGQMTRKYMHTQPCFGCHWSPFNPFHLAVAGGDWIIRVYDVQSQDVAPIRTLKGHSAKVFNVQWSPHAPEVLASGSDDFSVRVWNVNTGENKVLKGHVNYVRALQWHYEIPYLLLTGSWDGCIRVWDTRSAVCLRVAMDHHADVYGLATHPQRPFFFASCSRDTTLRFWVTEDFSASAKMLAIMPEVQWAEIVTGKYEDIMQPDAPCRLSGACSRAAAEKIALPTSTELDKVKATMELFLSPNGALELADILASVSTGAPCRFTNRVLHSDSVVGSLLSRAQELEQARSAHFQGVGKPTKADSLKAAALMYGRVGCMRQYCDILAEIGDWADALACAPAVSMEYWQSLVERRADELAAENDIAAVSLYVAAHKPHKAAEFHMKRNELDDAFAVTQCEYEGGFRKLAATISSPSPEADTTVKHVPDAAQTKVRREVVQRMARVYSLAGQPLLSACCLLAVGDVAGAVYRLVKGNEVETALLVLRSAPKTPHTEYVYQLAALRAERMGMWNLALQLLALAGSKGVDEVAARYAGTPEAIDAFYANAKLGSAAELKAKGAELASAGDPSGVRHLVLGRDYTVAASLGLTFLRKEFANPAWSIESVDEVLKWLTAIPSGALTDGSFKEILAYSYFIGAIKAIWKGYGPIVSGLVTACKEAAPAAEAFALSMDLLSMMEAQYHLANISASSIPATTLVANLQEMKGLLAAPAQQLIASSVAVEPAADVPATTNQILPTAFLIPSAAGRRGGVNHCLTGNPIQGPEYWVTNGSDGSPPRAMSLADALMWCRVCPFAPGATGLRINAC